MKNKSLLFIYCTLIIISLCSCSRMYRVPEFPIAHVDLDEAEWVFHLDPEEKGVTEGWFEPEYDVSGWKEIEVPGYWEDQGYTQKLVDKYGDFLPYNGFAWYRTRIPIPEEWRGYPLRIFLHRLDDDDVIYLNGVKIGETTGVTHERIYTIPVDCINYGEMNTLAVRIFDGAGNGGFVPGKDRIVQPLLPLNQIELDVDIETPGTYIFSPGDDTVISIKVTNPLEYNIPIQLSTYITDFFNEPLYCWTQNSLLTEKSQKVFTYVYKPEKKGHFTVHCDLKHGAMNIKSEFGTFAILPSEKVEVAKRDSYPFGLCAGALFHIPLEQIPQRGEQRLSLAEHAGGYWGRNDLWWGLIEAEQGQFDWTKADAAVTLFRKHNISLLAILCYSSAWSDNTAPATDEEIARFANYARQMVRRYKDYVKHWEIWNEPNIPFFWPPEPNPAHYAKLLKASYKAIKEEDPDATVVACATSLVDLDFIEAVLKEGTASAMDALSVHPYQFRTPEHPQGELAKLPELFDLLDRNGLDDMPVWITEIGWQTVDPGDEVHQAVMLAQTYVHCLSIPRIKRIYWYNLDDDLPRDARSGECFGLVYHSHMPKPSYVAYYTTARLLANTTFVMHETRDDIQHYIFKSEETGDEIHVLWRNRRGEKTIEIVPAETSRGCMITNIMGEEYHCEDEQIRLNINRIPLFVIGKNLEIQ